MASIDLVHSGEDYFFRVKNLIDKAQSEVHLQTYLLAYDKTGQEITNALIQAAERKVAVHVLLDSYGSGDIPTTIIAQLRQKGIQVRFFSPWHSKKLIYVGRRLHHKVIVVDGMHALVGGINISDKYRGSEAALPWLDYAVYIEDDTIGLALQQLCRNIYFKTLSRKRNRIQSVFLEGSTTKVHILRNDWFRERNEIFNHYLKAIQSARGEIVIVASYFLPGKKLMTAIRKATRRNVSVKIVLSGVSDLPVVMRATQYLYGYFLQQGVELYEWKKSILHAKIAVVDNHWSTTGSFNLNDLSYYANIEMNASVDSIHFSQHVRHHLQAILDGSERITMETLAYREDLKSKILNWVSYLLVRLALRLVIFFANRRVSGNPPV
jgi:cardiolipin synthase A/B